MTEMVVAVAIMVIITALCAGLFVQVRKMVGLAQWSAEVRTQMRAFVDALAQDLQSIDTDAWFIIYCRDERGRQLWHDVPNATYTRWSDRITFAVLQPSVTLQCNEAMVAWGKTVKDFFSLRSRVFYGHAAEHPNGIPTDRAPWWAATLARRAILQVSDPQGDPEDLQYLNPAVVAQTPWIDERDWWDHEFALRTVGSYSDYTYSDIIRWLGGSSYVSAVNFLVLAGQGKVEDAAQLPAVRSEQRTLTLRSRVLLPWAYKIRFQVRLSDGKIWPRVLNINSLTNIVSRINADPQAQQQIGQPEKWIFQGDLDCVDGPVQWWSNWAESFVEAWAAWAGPKVINDALDSVQDPPSAAAGKAWPVALRVRIEVYDPKHRTPDPIVLDTWLPIRWRKQPQP